MTPRKRASPWAAPSSWLLANSERLPRVGRALDIACGAGRHSLWLAERGWRVRGVDDDPEAIETLRAAADSRGLTVDAQLLDLESEQVELGSGAYDLVVVLYYLHRPLFSALCGALVPGGLLLYETFLEGHGKVRKPSRPEHLLKPGELRALVSPPLEVLVEREGEFDGRLVASILAQAPADLGPVSRG